MSDYFKYAFKSWPDWLGIHKTIPEQDVAEVVPSLGLVQVRLAAESIGQGEPREGALSETLIQKEDLIFQWMKKRGLRGRI